jgi:hypothetical protein
MIADYSIYLMLLFILRSNVGGDHRVVPISFKVAPLDSYTSNQAPIYPKKLI